MPKFRVTSQLQHDGHDYAEGSEVELSQELAERCGAVDPVPLPDAVPLPAAEQPASKGKGKDAGDQKTGS